MNIRNIKWLILSEMVPKVKAFPISIDSLSGTKTTIVDMSLVKYYVG